MTPEKTKPKFFIHPSIDALAESIKKLDGTASAAPEAIESLRETCVRKLRSYKLDDYLKRFASEPEKVQARLRWGLVIEFANRKKSSLSFGA